MYKPIFHSIGQWRVVKERLKRSIPNIYFYLFYGALGTVLPFLNIYYQSIGLNPWQIGLLGGLRPLVALFSGPFWCFLMNSYKLRKSVLVFSLIGWIAFTVPLGFLHHRLDGNCSAVKTQNLINASKSDMSTSANNSTFERQLNIDNYYWKESKEREILSIAKAENRQNYGLNMAKKRQHKRAAPLQKDGDKNNAQRSVQIGQPIPNSFGLMGLTFRKNPYKEIRAPYDVKSRGTPYVNRRINPYATTIFIEIFFIVLLGEILQAPTDDVNIHYDGTFLEPLSVFFQNSPRNGIYSAVGVSSFALITGILLKFSPQYLICNYKYADYRMAFSIFAVLMSAAVLVSMYLSLSKRKKTKPFNFFQSLKELYTLNNVGFFGLVFLMGIFRGVLSNFLYWNIKEIGGSELTVGVTVVCQNISDSLLAIASPILMQHLGFIGMVFCGLASYALRFLIFSWLNTSSSSWAIPSVELLQGFSHSAAWSAFILYIVNHTPRSTYPVGIFLVQAVYLGLGTTMGAMLAGVMIERLETNVTFRVFALMSLFSCLLFTLTQPTGLIEVLPGEIEPTSCFIEEDGYSSLSEEELLFDYNRKNVIYIPPKDDDEEENVKTHVLTSSNSPLVSTFISYVNKPQEIP